MPTRLGTPLKVWVDAAAAPAFGVAGVFGRTVRRRDSSSLSAFYSLSISRITNMFKEALPHKFASYRRFMNYRTFVDPHWML
jgi:hypothetical protein